MTGYSIKYAWRAALARGRHRAIVLVTDRRIDAARGPALGQPRASATAGICPSDAEFTLIEMRLDPAGRRRGQDVADDEYRGRCGGADARPRRLSGGAGAAEGHTMMRPINRSLSFQLGTRYWGVGLRSLVSLLGAASAQAGPADVADAAKRGDRAAVRAALARKADVNATQVDGSTALHWAVERDDVEMADLLLRAGRA